MHKTMEEVSRLCDAQKKLMEMFEGELSEGKEYFGCHAEEIGEISDMIKDMAEAAKATMEKKYYEEVVFAMLEYGDSDELKRMGYDNWRYKSGRFAPKGHGTDVGHGRSMKMGFDSPWPAHMRPYMPIDMYRDDWEGDGLMHDAPYRMGYPMDDMYRDMQDPERGRIYEDYKRARKHYTQTHDETSEHRMNDKIMEKTMETVDTMGEMWRDANPETKKQMKHNLMQLLEAWDKSK